MISGISKAMLLMLVLASTTALANAPELLKRLQRPGPDSIEFVELRYSKMLKTPLRAEGTLRYNEQQQLERDVTRPHRELTQITNDAVTIQREGGKTRTVALDRVPELRVLLNSFSALLTGDTTALERDFALTTSEEQNAWQIRLEPRLAKLKQRVPELTITGHADDVRCFTMNDARGGATVMVLGPASQQLPDTTDRTRIEQHCRAS